MSHCGCNRWEVVPSLSDLHPSRQTTEKKMNGGNWKRLLVYNENINFFFLGFHFIWTFVLLYLR